MTFANKKITEEEYDEQCYELEEKISDVLFGNNLIKEITITWKKYEELS
jgi:hypothetical protein